VFGLIIAIIAMIFYYIFNHIIDRFAAKVEGGCSVLIIQLAEQAEEDSQEPETKADG
jgi:biopolymer transport protein ExbB/TolQ